MGICKRPNKHDYDVGSCGKKSHYIFCLMLKVLGWTDKRNDHQGCVSVAVLYYSYKPTDLPV